MKYLIFICFIFAGLTATGQCNYGDTATANAASLVTTTTARVTGTSHISGSGTQLSAYLSYVRVGYTDTATASGSNTNLTRNLTGLVPGTQYVYYYSTVCNSGTIRQLGRYYFTTLGSNIIYSSERATVFPYIKADSGLIVPRLDTGLNRSANIGGQIKFRPADSLFYGYNGRIWAPLAVDSFGIITALNRKVDSVTVYGDSLFYWVNGTSYGWVLSTLGNRWYLGGNTGLSPDLSIIGNQDSVDFVGITNNVERFRWNANGALGVGSPANYGTAGWLLKTNDSIAAPTWVNPATVVGNYAWNLTGNAGTTAGTNFIGTTDGQGLMFKVDNTQAGYIDVTNNNTSLGKYSLINNTIGVLNAGFGRYALNLNTSGNDNSAFGDQSLGNNTTGSNNAAFGYNTLGLVTTGSNNAAFGSGALILSTGNSNIALGNLAGNHFTSESYRLFIGSVSTTSKHEDSTKSIIYGAQDATAANQRLYLNSQVYLPYATSGVGTKALRINPGTGLITYADTTASSGGTVTSVAQSFTGGLISVAGSPITTSGTLALTVAGTSGGIPYFSSGSTWASSAALTANALLIGGGAGVAPSSTTTGTGVLTALGVNVGTAGAFVVNGGALGTPSSGTVTNLTGTASININGTVGATTPTTGAFTGVTNTSQVLTSAETTGNGFAATSSTITTGSLMSLTNTGTAAASNTKKVLSIVSSGANATASQTVTGQTISVTNTGTTNTNVGLNVTASGATNNYSIIAPSGKALFGGSSLSYSQSAMEIGSNYKFSIVPDYGGNGDFAANSALMGSITGDFNIFPALNNVGTGVKVNIGYYNGSVGIVSALQIANTASGYGNLLLMKGGGNVGVGTTSPNSTTHVNGSFATAYVAKSGNYTATIAENIIKVTATPVTITLPTAVGITGREYIIVNASSGNITVATTSSQNIGNFNVATTLTIPSDGSYTLASDNAGWVIKNKF